jgi:hypothetical protein
MRVLALSSVVLLLAACKSADNADNAADTTATVRAATAADFAGTWQMTGRSEAGDSLLSYRLVVDSTGAGTLTFADGRSVPGRLVSIAGDSIITEAGPYESALRRGVQVRTHSIMRRNGDRLEGVTHATYALRGGDSTVTIRQSGTRVP